MQTEKRREQILILLSSDPEKALTATQIYDELFEWFGQEVCRRTIARDVDLLVKRGEILMKGIYPPRYYKSEDCILTLRLTAKEIALMLQEIQSKGLRDKLSKFI